MTSRKRKSLKLGVFTADTWEHVCPIVRFRGPANFAGFELVPGVAWEDGEIKISPEVVSQVDAVLIVRDFARHFKALQQIVDLAQQEEKPVVYELDDLLLLIDEDHPDYAYYTAGRADTIRLLRQVDAAIGSTPQICDYLRTWTPHVWHFPNYLDDQIWRIADRLPAPPPESYPVVIGYMGGHSHQADLEMIATVLSEINARFGDRVYFKFYGVEPPGSIRNDPNVEYINPSLVSYAEFADYFSQQQIDIFIAPLRDTPFNRSKSHLKYLEYSALGIAGVYSRVAPYESIVAQGENGFLAASQAEWLEYVSLLIENSELRHRVGEHAFETVRAEWLLSAHADDWAGILEQVQVRQRQDTLPETDQYLIEQITAWYREVSGLVAQTKQLQQKAYFQSVTIRDLEVHAENLARQKQQAEDLLDEITSSRGWLVLEKIRALRVRWAPYGSRRERMLLWLFESANILRRDGVKAWLHHTREKTRASIAAAQQAGPVLRAALVPAEPKTLPLCSVLILDGATGVDQQAVLDWCHAQTCRSMLELVFWDVANQVAGVIGENERSWNASNLAALLEGLESPYLCIASPDLLQQSATYLETNLMALEGEALLFTLNLRGHTPWAQAYFEKGLLPGSKEQPLLRTVVHRDVLRDGFILDLGATLQESDGMPRQVGKVIAQTSSESDAEDSLPFETSIPNVDLIIKNQRILMRKPSNVSWENVEITYPVHAIDEVLPIIAEPDDRPTMILVQTVLAVGGAERVHLDMMNYLKDDVRFVVLTGEPMDASVGTTAEAHRAITPYVYTAPDYLDWKLNLSHLIYLIKRFQPQVLYFANGVNWMYDILPDLKRRYPDLRMGNQVYDYAEGWINRYNPALVACFEAHIGVNHKIGRAFIEHGAKLEHVYVIPNGISTNEYDPSLYSEQQKQVIRFKLGIPTGKKVVTFISRVAPQKRPMDFVETARRFAQDPSVIFLLIGDGPLGEIVNAEIERTGMKNIIRHSFYRPSSDVFAVADVLMLPSEYEGMPMVILEAQAMGVPVVVTDVGNNLEVLEITQGGIVIPSIGDITGLMNGVQKMLAEPPDPDALRQAIITNFSLAKMGEDYRQALLG